MALVTFETYAGEKVNLNPEHVQAVTSHMSYDESIPLPDALSWEDKDGLRQPLGSKKAEIDALRTSEHTLVLMTSGTSFEVKGTVDKVLATLKGK